MTDTGARRGRIESRSQRFRVDEVETIRVVDGPIKPIEPSARGEVDQGRDGIGHRDAVDGMTMSRTQTDAPMNPNARAAPKRSFWHYYVDASRAHPESPQDGSAFMAEQGGGATAQYGSHPTSALIYLGTTHCVHTPVQAVQATACETVFDRLGAHAEVKQLTACDDAMLLPHQIPKPGGDYPPKLFRGIAHIRLQPAKLTPGGHALGTPLAAAHAVDLATGVEALEATLPGE